MSVDGYEHEESICVASYSEQDLSWTGRRTGELLCQARRTVARSLWEPGSLGFTNLCPCLSILSWFCNQHVCLSPQIWYWPHVLVFQLWFFSFFVQISVFWSASIVAHCLKFFFCVCVCVDKLYMGPGQLYQDLQNLIHDLSLVNQISSMISSLKGNYQVLSHTNTISL